MIRRGLSIVKSAKFSIRGFFGLLISIGLFLPGTTAKLAEIYVACFFIANGILSLKVIRQLEEGERARFAKVPPYVSVIGGAGILLFRLLAVLAIFTLSFGDIGRYLFGPIVVIIGLFQIKGRIRIAPDIAYKVIERSSAVLGILEILLGITVLIYEPVDWEVKTMTHIWMIAVTIIMFATHYRLRKIERAERTQPVSQK